MKKITALFAAITLATALGGPSVLNAGNTEINATASAVKADGSITRNYSLGGFRKLEVGGKFQVKLTKSQAYSIKLTFPEEYEKRVFVRLEEDELKIGIDNNIFRNIEGEFIAEISMPELRSLELNGAATLSCDDTFDLGKGGEFSLDLSGASRVKSLSVKAGEIEGEFSGASLCKMDGEFTEAELEFSGAAEGTMKLSGGTLKIDNSGAAKPKITGKFDWVSLEDTGAGEVTLEGSTESLSIDAGGAAKVKAGNFTAGNATVETSGAASCTVNVTGSLTVRDASGASSIRYSGTDNVHIISVGRAASVNKIN